MNREYPRKNIRLPTGAYRQSGSAWLITIGTNDRNARHFENSELASAVAKTFGARLASPGLSLDVYCLMPDHLHLIVQVVNGDLLTAIRDAKSLSTRTFWRFGGKGAMWQRGFHDRGLRTIEDYDAAVQYVLENPVRAGIVRDWEEYPHIGGTVLGRDD